MVYDLSLVRLKLYLHLTRIQNFSAHDIYEQLPLDILVSVIFLVRMLPLNVLEYFYVHFTLIVYPEIGDIIYRMVTMLKHFITFFCPQLQKSKRSPKHPQVIVKNMLHE